jgi:hypothetical protein
VARVAWKDPAWGTLVWLVMTTDTGRTLYAEHGAISAAARVVIRNASRDDNLLRLLKPALTGRSTPSWRPHDALLLGSRAPGEGRY